jgi:hypothetical protein
MGYAAGIARSSSEDTALGAWRSLAAVKASTHISDMSGRVTCVCDRRRMRLRRR